MKINRYLEIEKQFDNKNILVVGDVMLDNYLWGDVKRISPEAPVPIVDINESNSNPGGAANVASNLKSLGANVTIAGVVGDDRDGKTLRELLKVMHIDTVFLQTDLSLSTTVKTRIMAGGQQVIRADWESSSGMISENRLALLDQFKNDIKQFNGVILADYDKGLFDSDMISSLIEMCRTKDIPIFVDPKKEHFFDFCGVTLVKPNSSEAAEAAGVSAITEENIDAVGLKLFDQLKCDYLMVTRGEYGISLFDLKGHHLIPTRARSVHDVSGAGDTVISTFALAFLSGADFIEAAALANYAAGTVCEEVGVVSVTRGKLHEIINHHNS